VRARRSPGKRERANHRRRGRQNGRKRSFTQPRAYGIEDCGMVPEAWFARLKTLQALPKKALANPELGRIESAGFGHVHGDVSGVRRRVDPRLPSTSAPCCRRRQCSGRWDGSMKTGTKFGTHPSTSTETRSLPRPSRRLGRRGRVDQPGATASVAEAGPLT
jgi:hypothetical protein